MAPNGVGNLKQVKNVARFTLSKVFRLSRLQCLYTSKGLHSIARIFVLQVLYLHAPSVGMFRTAAGIQDAAVQDRR